MRIVNLFIAVISCLMIGASPSHPIKQCIDSLPGDSYSFGYSLATNDKYLVVGDQRANRVIIYRRDKNGKWRRTREILPPKDSTAYKVGRGFGFELALDGDVLVISTLIVINRQNNNNEVGNPEDFQESNIFSSTYTALYQTRLDRETEVKRIDMPDVPTKVAIPPGSVVADQGKIGFIISREEQPGKRINQVYVLSNGKIHVLPNGKLEYIFPSKVSSASIYGGSMALKNNLLLVGIARSEDRGGVWLFDLNSPQSKPQKLTIPNASPAIISLAISERFVAVGNSPLTSIDRDLSVSSQTTLIRNIASGSTKVIDGYGGLSLDGNILARIRYGTSDGEIPSLLEVFRLDDDATPHLIQKRSDVERALVQNRLLITVQKTNSGKKICTEQVR